MVAVLGLVYDGGGAHHTAVVVYENVAHYREHPALEVGVLNILVLVVEHLQRCVLQQIVGVVAVGGEHVGEVQHV